MFHFAYPIPIPAAMPRDVSFVPPPDLPAAPRMIGVVSLVVPPPHPPSPRPHAENAEVVPSKPDAPQITPQLTAGEQADAERQTRRDIDRAENNLQVAYGKRLNAAQSDLAEKIRSFLGQSREAIRANDWVRAKNLAQKARVLSVELVNSL